MSGDHLRNRTVLAGLTPQERRRVEALGRTAAFPRGATLLAQGDAPTRLYLLQTGTVRLFRLTADGREVTAQIAGANTFIGLEALLTDEPYGLSAVALEPCCVLELTRPEAEQLFLENPAIALKAIRALCRSVTDAMESVLTYRLRNAHGRLVYALERLAETHGRREGDETVIDLPLTHQDLASLTGLSRQTVSGLLSSLRARGAIAVANRRIRLTRHFPWGWGRVG